MLLEKQKARIQKYSLQFVLPSLMQEFVMQEIRNLDAVLEERPEVFCMIT